MPDLVGFVVPDAPAIVEIDVVVQKTIWLVVGSNADSPGQSR